GKIDRQTLAQRQIDRARVLGIVINFHVCGPRVFGGFIGHHAARVVIFCQKIEFGDVTTSRRRLPFIKRRATNKPGSNSHFTISPGFNSFASRSDSRYRNRRLSLQRAMLVPSGWISDRSASRSTSGVSIETQSESFGQPISGVSFGNGSL